MPIAALGLAALGQLPSTAAPSTPPALAAVPIQERRGHANREYQAARAAYERGDFDTAEPLFKLAAEWAPEFPEPYFALAQLVKRLGRHDEARHYMAHVSQRMPQVSGVDASAGLPPRVITRRRPV